MSNKTDPYASAEETRALIVPDTRTAAERKLDQMLEERGASEQGAEPALILRQIAVELMAEQPAPATKLREQEPVAHREGFWCKDLTCKKCYSADFRFKHTTPAQRKPLTDEEIMQIGRELGAKCRLGGNPDIDFDYARAIEAAHGIKAAA